MSFAGLVFLITLVHNAGAQSYGDLRVIGSLAGRLEMYNGSQWGTVCDDGFLDTQAKVACNQLDYAQGKAVFGDAVPDGSGLINMDDVVCSGSESKMTDCNFTGNHNCGHSEDVGVECSMLMDKCANNPCGMSTFINGPKSYGELRVIGPLAGRLEMYNGAQWGTVCDDGFLDTQAKVACNQLDYAQGKALLGDAVPDGSGLINMDDVVCSGSESKMADCNFTSNHNCGHSEDVGVECSMLIDNCASNPCGISTCIDGINSRYCRCNKYVSSSCQDSERKFGRFESTRLNISSIGAQWKEIVSAATCKKSSCTFLCQMKIQCLAFTFDEKTCQCTLISANVYKIPLNKYGDLVHILYG